MNDLYERRKTTPDTRKEQLQTLAAKYDFDTTQKLYGVFAYWQQPGCYGCYILTGNHAHALKLKRRLVHRRYGDYDASGFCVVHDTAENLMLKYTEVSVVGFSDHFTFPDFLKKFKAFLKRSNGSDDETLCDFFSQVSAMHSTISKLIDCFNDLSMSQQMDVQEKMTLLKEKMEEFSTFHDKEESSLEW